MEGREAGSCKHWVIKRYMLCARGFSSDRRGAAVVVQSIRVMTDSCGQEHSTKASGKSSVFVSLKNQIQGGWSHGQQLCHFGKPLPCDQIVRTCCMTWAVGIADGDEVSKRVMKVLVHALSTSLFHELRALPV